MLWYERTFPTVEQSLPYIKDAAQDLSKTRGVKSVMVWGSFANILENPRSSTKNIDLLVTCSFDSEDLLAIDYTEGSPLGMTQEEMECLGFNPAAVAFTKKYVKYANYNIDQWAISKDGKLLHWGPVAETIEEWEGHRKIAEKAATDKTGISRKHLCKSSLQDRTRWKSVYDEAINHILCETTMGWYSSETNPEDILKKAVPLV